MLKKEIKAILKEYVKVDSSNLDKFKNKLQIMINSSLFKEHFNNEEIKYYLDLINNMNLKNVEMNKISLSNDILKRESDINNDIIRQKQLKKNKFNKNNPYGQQNP